MIIIKKHRGEYRQMFFDETDFWAIKIPSLTWWTLFYSHRSRIYKLDAERVIHGKV